MSVRVPQRVSLDVDIFHPVIVYHPFFFSLSPTYEVVAQIRGRLGYMLFSPPPPSLPPH